MIFVAPGIYQGVDEKTAFLAGVSRRCKQSSMDTTDEEQLARLLLLPEKQAAYIVGQLVMDRRESLVKGAGAALIKLGRGPTMNFASTLQGEPLGGPGSATSDDEQPISVPPAPVPGPPPMPGPPPLPGTPPTPSQPPTPGQPAEPGTSPTPSPPPEPDTSPEPPDPADGEGAPTASDGSTATPPMSLDDTAPTEVPQPDAAAAGASGDFAEMAGGGGVSSIDLNAHENQKQEDAQKKQRDLIAQGFSESVTPGMRAHRITGDWIEQMQRRGIQRQDERTTMRGLQRSLGLHRRPVRGGLRPGDIDPSQTSDPDLKRLAEWQRADIAKAEERERTFGGLRSGWSTMGSGFSGGGVRAARGRQPTALIAAPPESAVATPGAIPSASPTEDAPIGSTIDAAQPTIQRSGEGYVGRASTGGTMRGVMGGGELPPMPPPPAQTTAAPEMPAISAPPVSSGVSPTTTGASAGGKSPVSLNYKARSARRVGTA